MPPSHEFPVLALQEVVKRFPGVLALKGVSMEVRRGEVHALVGGNGAGKSTLVKVAAGALAPDSGDVWVHGERLQPNPRAAQALGVRMLYQERQIAPDLTVGENVLLDGVPVNRFGLVSWREMARQASQRLARLEIELDPALPVRRLSTAQLQLLEIARAVSFNARLVVMDEPSASLHREEIEVLVRVVRRMREQGVGVLYISHHLDEVFDVADRVTVLRDGEVVDTATVSDIDMADLVFMMFGRDLALERQENGTTQVRQRGAPALVAQGVHVERALHGVDLMAHRGEILVVTGGVGSGVRELAEVLAGARQATAGNVRTEPGGQPIRSRIEAVTKGIAFLPQDRKGQGLLIEHPVVDNIMLGRLTLRSGMFVSPRTLRLRASALCRTLRIMAPSVDTPVRNLSGGNQQKVILGRWLDAESDVLIFDEPTVGIDVASKFEIYQRMQELAHAGAAIIAFSNDYQEIQYIAQRVVVLRKGKVAGELIGAEITVKQLSSLDMVG